MTREELTAIDLFCGAGGLSQGFMQAGFDIVAANDFDRHAASTFKLNHPGAAFFDGPIEDIDPEDFLNVSNLKQGELDVLIGGPPCQAFSVNNHQRGMHDARSGLFREYLRMVEGLMPRAVVMENVTGITSVAGGRAVEEIYLSLEQLGFRVEHQILKAEEFGVPQERRRIFFVAIRDGGSFRWPRPTHQSEPDLLTAPLELKPFVTVEDAIYDLPALQIAEGEEVSNYDADPLSDYQKKLREKSPRLYNHVAPSLADINLQRLKHIPQGGSWRDIPDHLLPTGMQSAKRSDHTKRYGRLHPQGLASTILTKCDLHWGAYIHPTQERSLTVREAARFQSFEDRIRFTGSRMEQFRQVGNAVPPLLAEAVAQSVAHTLCGAYRQDKELIGAC